jgi:hypothetical protein
MRILITLDAGAGSQAGGVPEYVGLIAVYYLFSDAGLDVVLAAPGGGSASEFAGNDSARGRVPASQIFQRFMADRRARDAMNDLVDLASVCADDFDAAFCLGSQGSSSGSVVNGQINLLVGRLLGAAKPVVVAALPDQAAPAGRGSGIVIIGNSNAPWQAAEALLGAIGVQKR